MKNKCCAKGCKRPMVAVKHKLCSTHYMRFYRKGDIEEGRPIITRRVLVPYRAIQPAPEVGAISRKSARAAAKSVTRK